MKKFNYDDFDMFRSIKVEDICSYNSKDVDGKELENGFMWFYMAFYSF
jgi:hypothetical protein